MHLYVLTTHEVSTMASLDRSANGEVKFTGENTAWPEQGFQELVTVSWILCLNNRANAPIHHSHTWQKSHAQPTRTHSSGCPAIFHLSVLTLTVPSLPACLCQGLMPPCFLLPLQGSETAKEPTSYETLVTNFYVKYSSASTPACSSTGISHGTANGLQLKKQILGWFPRMTRSCPMPLS